jgi:RNA polymerase sigma-70 factor (ECF subfamily)
LDVNAAYAMKLDTPKPDAEARFEAMFDAQFERIARVIGRVIADPGRAEELAVEVFLKWRNRPTAQGEQAEGWLFRTATREAIDEWRRQERRRRFERVAAWFGGKVRSPEEELASSRTAGQVRAVLAGLKRRDSDALLLWSEGFSYHEIAQAILCSSTVVGSILQRAQVAFKKDYVRRYGNES